MGISLGLRTRAIEIAGILRIAAEVELGEAFVQISYSRIVVAAGVGRHRRRGCTGFAYRSCHLPSLHPFRPCYPYQRSCLLACHSYRPSVPFGSSIAIAYPCFIMLLLPLTVQPWAQILLAYSSSTSILTPVLDLLHPTCWPSVCYQGRSICRWLNEDWPDTSSTSSKY